ncbi:hypothetical protein BDQ94DRAFT_155088 [Aspergillus welwitschiae]|uniref:Uncharacterized protein n=1 Tax=Aspergillus welwitschiae TaxID=1341132 RepID=A0A3F3PIF8_9EURO|nr:hypothetical protein BDQ94DRAFT_155088 [Aspergillus welwitschiae]RDH26719.1 hypothetical protein BDQ94DRAFT_155088 [Aspergillus welwitschiae]
MECCWRDEFSLVMSARRIFNAQHGDARHRPFETGGNGEDYRSADLVLTMNSLEGILYSIFACLLILFGSHEMTKSRLCLILWSSWY